MCKYFKLNLSLVKKLISTINDKSLSPFFNSCKKICTMNNAFKYFNKFYEQVCMELDYKDRLHFDQSLLGK